ncbi:MAG: hypothetical protein EZS28_016422 [Streblomastix strix]|uniref:Uncharacterized protein n=1 Tax=Streblomastix strix TaxID=222440 RepID=A0A5J4VZQ9_9EUKA|nr:MAG: hypothetical protein EZS28_016422 [Streblomastix strix]
MIESYDENISDIGAEIMKKGISNKKKKEFSRQLCKQGGIIGRAASYLNQLQIDVPIESKHFQLNHLASSSSSSPFQTSFEQKVSIHAIINYVNVLQELVKCDTRQWDQNETEDLLDSLHYVLGIIGNNQKEEKQEDQENKFDQKEQINDEVEQDFDSMKQNIVNLLILLNSKGFIQGRKEKEKEKKEQNDRLNLIEEEKRNLEQRLNEQQQQIRQLEQQRREADERAQQSEQRSIESIQRAEQAEQQKNIAIEAKSKVELKNKDLEDKLTKVEKERKEADERTRKVEADKGNISQEKDKAKDEIIKIQKEKQELNEKITELGKPCTICSQIGKELIKVENGSDAQNKELRKNKDYLSGIISTSLQKKDELGRKQAINSGIAEALLHMFANQPLESITDEQASAFYQISFTNQENKLLIFDNKPYPALIRLLDHSNSSVVDRTITSITCILLCGLKIYPANTQHEHYGVMNKCEGINKIYALFKRINTLKHAKDLAAICIGLLFKASEITDYWMRCDIITHLKKLVYDSDEWMKNASRERLKGLAQNLVNKGEIEKGGFVIPE